MSNLPLPRRQYKKMEWVAWSIENGFKTLVMRDAWAARLVELGMVVRLKDFVLRKKTKKKGPSGLYRVTDQGFELCYQIINRPI